MTSLVFPFTEVEYKKCITTLNNKKETGINNVLVEQLRTPTSQQMVTLNAKRMPHTETNPQSMEEIENYCNTEIGERLDNTEELHTYIPPITCHIYKLYDRLILNRIVPSVEQHLIMDQPASDPGSYVAVNLEPDSTLPRTATREV